MRLLEQESQKPWRQVDDARGLANERKRRRNSLEPARVGRQLQMAGRPAGGDPGFGHVGDEALL